MKVSEFRTSWKSFRRSINKAYQKDYGIKSFNYFGKKLTLKRGTFRYPNETKFNKQKALFLNFASFFCPRRQIYQAKNFIL